MLRIRPFPLFFCTSADSTPFSYEFAVTRTSPGSDPLVMTGPSFFFFHLLTHSPPPPPAEVSPRLRSNLLGPRHADSPLRFLQQAENSAVFFFFSFLSTTRVCSNPSADLLIGHNRPRPFSLRTFRLARLLIQPFLKTFILPIPDPPEEASLLSPLSVLAGILHPFRCTFFSFLAFHVTDRLLSAVVLL